VTPDEYREAHGMDDDAVRDVTRVVRHADEAFERSGGSSRHWVRECFLPAMEGAGLRIARLAAAERPITDDAVREALACFGRHTERELWDGFEGCIEDCDDEGKPKCSMLAHTCGTCHGCYADENDSEPEEGAECSGGGDYSCHAIATITAALADRERLREDIVALNDQWIERLNDPAFVRVPREVLDSIATSGLGGAAQVGQRLLHEYGTP
jgi:hypothetical protein